MDLTTITVADFEAQFRRDFPYLPIYDPLKVYNTGDVIYYPPTNLFYQSIQDTIKGIGPVKQYDHGDKYDAAGVQYDANKQYWIKYVQDIDNYICDADITNAFQEAMQLFNPALFAGANGQSSDASQKLGFLYLSAHFVCNDINQARGGVNGTGHFPMTARTVGSVSESYQIPEIFANTPNLAMYAQTSYGLKYLNMILPNMTGNMAAVWGGSHA